ncbi:MAG: hypothetical protein AAB430_03620 [Patescibacteria group bacterium]
MATLTETAASVRKMIKFGALFLGLILIYKIGQGVYNTYLKVAKPSPAPAPTVAFGKLPTISFPEKLHPELTLRLETPTGGTPNLGDRAKVYLMPTFRSSFMALDQAKATAKRLGFTGTAKEITERRFIWENNEFLPSTLEMDIINGSYNLKRNWQSDPTILTDKQLPGKEQTMTEAKNFLRQAGTFGEELESAAVNISYLNFSGGQYAEAPSLSEADFVQADFFRPKVDEKPVLTTDPKQGIVRLIFSGSRETEKKVVEAIYNYFPVSLEQNATYPIKTASQAWRELQTRQGFIASTGNNPNGVITIRNIYLGYYDGETSNGFLLPIIVFEGDNGFYGYVIAITSEWLEASSAKQN